MPDRATSSDPTGFSGDTRIGLVDGTQPTFWELSRLPADEVFQVWSIVGNELVVGQGRNSRVVRPDAQMVEVRFDDGTDIRCTPDQLFLLKDVGVWWAEVRPEGMVPVPKHDPGWLPAEDLDFTMALMAFFGDPADVSADNMVLNHPGGGIEELPEPVDAYNLVVEPYGNVLLAGCGCFVRGAAT